MVNKALYFKDIPNFRPIVRSTQPKNYFKDSKIVKIIFFIWNKMELCLNKTTFSEIQIKHFKSDHVRATYDHS